VIDDAEADSVRNNLEMQKLLRQPRYYDEVRDEAAGGSCQHAPRRACAYDSTGYCLVRPPPAEGPVPGRAPHSPNNVRASLAEQRAHPTTLTNRHHHLDCRLSC
jgi:hypothetical protein